MNSKLRSPFMVLSFFLLLSVTGCSFTKPSQTARSSPTNSPKGGTTLADKIVGVWGAVDLASTASFFEFWLVDFGRNGNLVFNSSTKATYIVQPYSVKSETTILVGNVYIVDVKEITDQTLDIVWNSTNNADRTELHYQKLANPISNFAEKIVGRWNCTGDNISFDQEFFTNGLEMKYEILGNYYDGERNFVVETDNTIVISDAEIPIFTLKVANDSYEAAFTMSAEIHQYKCDLIPGFSDLAKQVIGSWVNQDGSGAIEFTSDGTYIDHQNNSVGTYQILSPNAIQISVYKSPTWIDQMSANSLSLNYQGKVSKYQK